MPNLLCPQCSTLTIAPARFCNNCGVGFSVQPIVEKPKSKNGLVLIILLAVLGVVSLPFQKPDDAQTIDTTISANQPLPASPPVWTDSQRLQKARELIKTADPQQLQLALGLLKSIPKTAKEYREGEKLITDLGRIVLEREVLGQRPISGKAEVSEYLSQVINDYGSSEFVQWSEVEKVYLKKEPYWSVKLRIRAKNAFGAYTVKDAVFYIRQGQVVKAQGL